MQSTRIIGLILALNILVYLGWTLSSDVDFFVAHFLVSMDALKAGRVWVLLTSVFSHLQFFHLVINMMVLRSFGPVIVLAVGRNAFIRFYLMAGLVSSLSHALVSTYFIHDPSIPALGASGSLAGLILLFSLLFPREKLLLLGFIPMRAIWGAVLFVGLDLWGLSAQSKGGGFNIGHGAHLGGAVYGMFYFVWLRFTKNVDRSMLE